MTMSDAIRKMTDDELVEFIVSLEITIIRKFASQFNVNVEQEIENEMQSLIDGTAEILKSEIKI